MGKLRIIMAQLNLLVGDIAGNTSKIIEAAESARDEHQADLVVFPELTLTGYPPEDLLLRPALHEQIKNALDTIRQSTSGIGVIFGYPEDTEEGTFNTAICIADGEILAKYRKQYLPNYGVFDEKRYFIAASAPCVFIYNGVRLGVTICEDIWQSGPVNQAKHAGARLALNLNASPFHANKRTEREDIVKRRAKVAGIPIVYVNLVGGQDELVFDGESFVVNSDGKVTQRAIAFEERLEIVDFSVDENGNCDPEAGPVQTYSSGEESVYRAVVLGIRDYIEKNLFKGVVIGLSGGIDSALTLAMAVDALGADRVEAVLMPSQYTAEMSVNDAVEESRLLGVRHRIISIESVYQAFLDTLKDEFAGTTVDTTEENIQARCRGIILMAIANKNHKIVLTTGNKSEMSVGYATLYGDMAGGYAPLKDLPKLMVYRLSRYRNSISRVIPERVITRPPSAELAPDQKDEDSLPPYEILDPILEMYIERDISPEEIIVHGFDEATVHKVVTMVNRNEYKRRQAVPGVRITQRAFGRDRRYPITSGYTEIE
ncbi:MAG: NAD+ synthase [Gammaproteobacteria bacterium]